MTRAEYVIRRRLVVGAIVAGVLLIAVLLWRASAGAERALPDHHHREVFMADDQSNVFNINRAGDDQLHLAALGLYDEVVTECVDYDDRTGGITVIDYDGLADACVKYLRRFAHERPDAYVGSMGRHPSNGVK